MAIPILFHIKSENTLLLIIFVWITQITSSLDTNIMSIEETFSDDLVKIRPHDVT